MISGSDWMMPASGIGLHRGGEPHDAIAGHEAVGVEHEHVLVVPAPAADEIGDVAGLAVIVLRPMPVVEPRISGRGARAARGMRAPPRSRRRVGRIGQDEIVERVPSPVASTDSRIASRAAKVRAVCSL